jgi:predicted phage terminase large subunit-like protein
VAAPAVTVTVDEFFDVVQDELQVQEEAEQLSQDYYGFVRAAWPQIEPHTPFKDNWHIPAICEALTAVTTGEIRHLQIWVPPGSMKSILASILWPVWEWTRKPWLRYITGSYSGDLATDFSIKARDVILSEWYRLRWPDVQLRPDANQKDDYITTEGGRRFVTSPDGGVTGRHAHRIIIDDPLKPLEIASAVKLEQANKWYSGTLATRAADPTELAEVIIMQRLHTNDLAAYAMQYYDDWEVVCLPERYDPGHKYLWPRDERTVKGELLWPRRVGEKENKVRVAKLGAHEAEGQLQQNPTAREGDLLKRADWRYFDRKQLDREPGTLQFTRIITSWDTAFKDKTSSDFVAGQVWGVRGADRFFLRSEHRQMAFGATKRAIQEFDQWVRLTWPGIPLYHVIEKSANGTEIIDELKREIVGIVPWSASVDKLLRAQAASPTLESHNCFLPGAANAAQNDCDPNRTPAWVQEFIEECAQFNRGEHDDQVDAWSQAMNYINSTTYATGGLYVPEGEI